MAALLKDDGTLVEAQFLVGADGVRLMNRAIAEPKKPNEKLIALMQSRKDRRVNK